MGGQGLADESAGKATGEKPFHYTLDNREASKRQAIVYTAELAVGFTPTVSKLNFSWLSVKKNQT